MIGYFLSTNIPQDLNIFLRSSVVISQPKRDQQVFNVHRSDGRFEERKER
jgi:hypothetical protein